MTPNLYWVIYPLQSKWYISSLIKHTVSIHMWQTSLWLNMIIIFILYETYHKVCLEHPENVTGKSYLSQVTMAYRLRCPLAFSNFNLFYLVLRQLPPNIFISLPVFYLHNILTVNKMIALYSLNHGLTFTILLEIIFLFLLENIHLLFKSYLLFRIQLLFLHHENFPYYSCLWINSEYLIFPSFPPLFVPP